MESRVKKTIENHAKGYNCAQSVACAYCDLVGMDEETIFKAAEAFGAGMGSMTATCGAVSGAVLLAGLKNSDGNLENPQSKSTSYALAKQIIEAFEAKNTTVICKELKGVETGVKIRTCDGCIEDAAEIAEKLIFSEEFSK